MADPRSENERRTRQARIDPKLTSWGWRVVPFDPTRSVADYTAHAVVEYPTANGPADYALIVDGQLLGVVEAKKVGLAPQTVLTQAERYSKGITGGSLNFGGYRAPFLYATNGEVLWFQDVRDGRNRSRRLQGFHTPAALAEMLARPPQDAAAWFIANRNAHPWLRPYQHEANDAVEKAIAERPYGSGTRAR